MKFYDKHDVVCRYFPNGCAAKCTDFNSETLKCSYLKNHGYDDKDEDCDVKAARPVA